jgi:SET domain-containing protein
MPFLKKFEIRDLSSKYGDNHRGIVALEPIHAGEPVFRCDDLSCNYDITEDSPNKLTRAEVLALIEAQPEAADYIRYYTYMVDDDLFNVPRHYKTQTVTEECVLFNHSCDANCGFSEKDLLNIVAIRDIAVGEELTEHYGCFDSEASFWKGLMCMCGAKNCVGELKFNFWRDENWQKKYAQYTSAYIQRKIDNLRKESEQDRAQPSSESATP